MANFDINTWYHIYRKGSTTLSLDGTGLYDAGSGASFMGTDTNPVKAKEHLWQIYPYNSTYYVLRTAQSGATGFLTVAVNVNETTPGKTVPIMRNLTLVDPAIFWQIEPWGDGTFFFVNGANGTEWHLNVKSNGLMAMSSNITAPQTGQAWTFTANSTINDSKFSSLPSASTSTSTSSLATQSGSTYTPKSSGLSTSTKAAIGSSIAAVVLIISFVIGFMLLRRQRRNNGAYIQAQAFPPDNHELYERPVEIGTTPIAGSFKDHKFDTDGTNHSNIPEMDASYGASELPGDQNYPRHELR